ncbi:Uncharacterised protein [Escherichia coli]|nr:Uncharacterised protein [Escherichia coli]
MRKFIFVLLTLLLVSPFSFAMKGIIWQPQNRDSQVTDTQWQGLMSQLRLQGFDYPGFAMDPLRRCIHPARTARVIV